VAAPLSAGHAADNEMCVVFSDGDGIAGHEKPAGTATIRNSFGRSLEDVARQRDRRCDPCRTRRRI